MSRALTAGALMATAVLSCLSAQAEPATLRVAYAPLLPAVTASPSDHAWNSATRIAALTPARDAPVAGFTVSPASVALLWNKQFLFIRFTCSVGPGGIYVVSGGDPKQLYLSDVAEIFIDPVGDSRQYFEIEAAPDGRVDVYQHLLTADPVSMPDGALIDRIARLDSWTIPNWPIEGLRHASSISSDGSSWIVDVALPATSLLVRLGLTNLATNMTLRANFIRYDHPELISGKAASRVFVCLDWTPISWGRPHISPQAMGELRLAKP